MKPNCFGWITGRGKGPGGILHLPRVGREIHLDGAALIPIINEICRQDHATLMFCL